MKPASFILLILLASGTVGAQKDPEARKILDRVSSRSQADYPISVSFEYIYDDLVNKKTSRQEGTLILDKDKFRLTLGESEVLCDGKTVWNFLKEANEVYISDADQENSSDDFFINNPSDLFTFYQQGFKYRLTREVDYMNKTYFEIDIYPEDLDKNYHTVKLLVEKKNYRIYSAEAFGKGGANHTLILKDYRPKVHTSDTTFVFNPDEHAGVEIVDTRF
jgi:outer membrane lipoprotein carrier protein